MVRHEEQIGGEREMSVVIKAQQENPRGFGTVQHFVFDGGYTTTQTTNYRTKHLHTQYKCNSGSMSKISGLYQCQFLVVIFLL